MGFNMRKINIKYFVHAVNTEGAAELCDITDALQQGSVERCSLINMQLLELEGRDV